MVILGAGVTGLAASWATRARVYEAKDHPGGTAASFFIDPKTGRRSLDQLPKETAYRFERCGGHWIFRLDPSLLKKFAQFSPLTKYSRQAEVFFPEKNLFIPYPLQDHAQLLKKSFASSQKAATRRACVTPVGDTLDDWLLTTFGPSLCKIFFSDFHKLYTAGLYRKIAPQDLYKSPAGGAPKNRGYNQVFYYPDRGLGHVLSSLAKRLPVYFKKRAARIDLKTRTIYFDDGSKTLYDRLISTIPLTDLVRITGIKLAERPNPYTSVLVLNIGAKKGARCPKSHWVYIPRNPLGFYRVGFYSNVCEDFLPRSRRGTGDFVSLYVEKAFLPDERPTATEIESYKRKTVQQLKAWGFIGEPEIVTHDQIPVAYTWAWPHSDWREQALQRLKECGIYSMGRYGAWRFQGIAESFREGLRAPKLLRERPTDV